MMRARRPECGLPPTDLTFLQIKGWACAFKPVLENKELAMKELPIPTQARRVGSTFSDTEFDLTRLLAQRERMVELGRSCVHADLPMMMRIKDLPPRYLKHFSAKLAVAEASL